VRSVPDLAASAAALLAENVALLDPEERVFEAMLAGWVRQQQARALRAETIRSRVSIVTRMHVHTNS
jgi:integrase/recombinase XerC